MKIEDTSAKSSPADHVRKRARSPAYPSIDLENAIEKCRVLHRFEKMNPMSVAIAANHWEMNAKSSASQLATAAIKYYGLAEEVDSSSGRQIKLSEAARRIILDERENSPDRMNYIQKSFLSAPIFRELWEKYAQDLPSDASLKHFLMFEKGYGDDASVTVLKNYRRSLAFAKMIEGETETITEVDAQSAPVIQEIAPMSTDTRVPTTSVRDLTFPLIGGGMAIFRAPIPMSEENFTLIESMFKAMKKAIVHNSEGTRQL